MVLQRLPLAIGYSSDVCLEEARHLSQRLQLPINNDAMHRLMVTPDKYILDWPPFSPIWVDFSRKTWQSRRDAGKRQGLVRAVKPAPGMRILDLTAGWGRDAAVLASFGSHVCMLERHPVIAALLEDALRRQDPHSQSVLQLSLFEEDATTYLSTLSNNYPDLIYLDPMHPQRDKQALVKKPLQMLQALIPPVSAEELYRLLSLARSKAKQAVVVKWPLHASFPFEQSASQQMMIYDQPQRSVCEKTVRFDIYVT